MSSWFDDKDIPIRDEGQAEYGGEKYAEDTTVNGILHLAGTLVVKDDGITVKDPPKEARDAWPAGTHMLSKPVMTGADLNEINRLSAKIDLVGKAANIEDLEVKAEFEIYVPAMIYVAVMCRGLVCPIVPAGAKGHETANAFEDPETREGYVDRNNSGKPGTGKLMAWPKTIKERLELAGKLPVPVLAFFMGEIESRLANPLPGSRPVKS